MPDTRASRRRIAVLTGGGDAPGLNAVLRAVVKTATIRHGWEVVGIEDGFEGLINGALPRVLTLNDVRGLLPRGGTILGTTSRGAFGSSSPAGAGSNDALDRACDVGVETLERHGIDGLVTIGGDGTQTIAGRFHERGVAIVGVPKTIDNDLAGTDMTFGFDSALALATDACDRLHTTAESHDRVLVLEVMGRTAGWIALHAGLAGGADCILVPEFPFDLERVADAVRRRDAAGHRFSIIVVAEGATIIGGAEHVGAPAGLGGPLRFGGVGPFVAAAVGERTGKDARAVVLGHLQRGGRPTAYDRLLATSLGAAAVRALADGATGCLIAVRGASLEPIPLSDVIGRVKRVPASSPLVRMALDLGIELGVPLDSLSAA